LPVSNKYPESGVGKREREIKRNREREIQTGEEGVIGREGGLDDVRCSFRMAVVVIGF